MEFKLFIKVLFFAFLFIGCDFQDNHEKKTNSEIVILTDNPAIDIKEANQSTNSINTNMETTSIETTSMETNNTKNNTTSETINSNEINNSVDTDAVDNSSDETTADNNQSNEPDTSNTTEQTQETDSQETNNTKSTTNETTADNNQSNDSNTTSETINSNETNNSVNTDTVDNSSDETTEENQNSDNEETNNTSQVVTPSYKVLPTELTTSFNVGFGGRGSYPFAEVGTEDAIWISSTRLMQDTQLSSNNDFQTKIRNFDADKFNELQQYLNRSKFLSFWMTEHWQESWFSKTAIQDAMDAGVIPVFMYWYFGDKLTTIPTGETLTKYYENNQKVVDFLNDLNGTILLVMEPEFNKHAVLETNSTQTEFATIMRQAITNIESNLTNVEAYFSLCMTDAGNRGVNATYASCGYDNCALGDKGSWSKTENIYKALDDKISFISFQQMVAQFSRDPSNPGTWNSPNPIAYTGDDLGIDQLAERIENFSTYLNETYNKPVFLPYMAIATATWDDSDNNGTISDNELDIEGWKQTPQSIYEGLAQRKESLKASGLFGYLPMVLFDNPRHDYGGYQYFMQNEYHLGIIQTSAEDETDKYIYGDLDFKGDVLEHIFGAI